MNRLQRSPQPLVVAVGECMLELSGSGGARRLGEGWRLGYGGDTFNTTVYLRRAGVPVAYFTALGTDGFSDELREEWSAEGVDLSLVLADPTRTPGLYAITTDSRGERSFTYWRAHAAVRRLFELPGIEDALARAGRADLLYLSGITLSLFGGKERERLRELARSVRAQGGRVAFDPNFRPAGWRDIAEARDAMAAIADAVSIALPTLDDEARLWGDADARTTIERWRSWGVDEVVVKLGADGAIAATGADATHVAAQPVAQVIDTTGAGDSFSAAYLAARLRGATPAVAAAEGNALAARVIQHRGAILPRQAIPG